jgi:uncharacterized repeat protein (TIGR01451 family)
MCTGEASVSHQGTRSGMGLGKRRTEPRWAAGGAALLAVCVSALSAGPAFGEGSVDFNTGPDTVQRNHLMMAGSGQSAAENRNRYSVLRVYARAGETIQMGSVSMQPPSGPAGNILVYPRGTDFASSTDPSVPAPLPGDPVFSTDILDCSTDDPGTGRIASRAQELAGPAPNPGGYVPCEFVAPADGIYPIVMLPGNPNASPIGSSTVGTPSLTASGSVLSMWDVTVRSAAGVVQPVRLFSHKLSFTENSGATTGPNPLAYLQTPAGYEYRVNLFSHRGQLWDLAANDRGVVDATTGNRIFASFQYGTSASNAVVYFEALAPQITAPDLAVDSRHPMFFKRVDSIVIDGPGGLGETRGFASAPISPSGALSGLTFTGAGGEQGATAQGSGGTIRFASPPQMNGLGYTVEIDLDQNGSFGDGNDVVDESGDLNAAGGNSFAWNGQDAAGATPACGSYAYRVRSTLAEVHLTMADVENSGGTQIERLSLPSDPALGNPFAASYNDTDPYKGTAVTNTSPVAVNDGVSGPTFHAWTANTGNTDFVDTWMRLPEVTASGTLQVCLPPPPPPGEVSVDKRASDGRVVVGDTVTYRLVAKNNSAGQADGVVVEDQVPSKLDVRSASSTQGDCTVEGNRVRCEIGALAVGEEATVTVRAVATEAGQSTNTGIVVAERCPAAQCDTDPATVTIVKPKLRVAKTAAKARVRAGNTVTYAIRVTNPSKRAVRNVRTCDLLPAGLVPVSTTPKVKVSKGRYCWTTRRLGAGKSKRYEIIIRALPGAAGRTVTRATASSPAARSTARAARAVRVLGDQGAGGGVTG